MNLVNPFSITHGEGGFCVHVVNAEIISRCYINASVGNELGHHGLPIQRFHTSRLAQGM